MPSLASSSARSLPGSPLCPLTQRQVISCGAIASTRCCHRSRFFTGCLPAVRHPLRCQPGSHLVIPSSTYRLSVYSVTVAGRFSASSAEITAVSSMRLFVVSGSLPCSSRTALPYRSTAPQPPGPGFPLHAPSV